MAVNKAASSIISMTYMSQWPHAPLHLLNSQGVYIITAGTYQKAHLFNSQQKLNYLQTQLFNLSVHYSWTLHAWALFSNHYHFVADSPKDASTLSSFMQHLHQISARELNHLDGTASRKVWYQYWDSKITHQTSYLARLNYVHKNPVKHGLVAIASHYPWCSAAHFELKAPTSFVQSVYSFDYEKVKVFDDF